MFRSFRTLTHPFFIPVLITIACGGGQTGGEGGDEADAAGSAGDESGSAGQNEQGEGGHPQNTKPSKGGSAGRGGSSGASRGGGASDAGADAGGASAGGAGGAGGEAGGSDEGEAACVSTGSDAPDDDFVDSNCDGIDGDFARAVFVSPAGSDGADGALATPLRSIDAALELAATTGRDVYVCNGTFIEPVTIMQPVAVYGGYDCENGARRTKDRAVVAPPRGVALTVQNVAGKVHVERLAFRAADAVLPGESAQAGRIVASSDVTFSRVEFSAGKGADGTLGAPGADASQVAPFKGTPGSNAPPSICNLNSMTSACQSAPPGGFDAQLTHSCEKDGLTLVQRGGSGGAGANVWIAQGRPEQFGAQSVSVNGEFYGLGTHFSEGIFKSVHPLNSSSRGYAGIDGPDATLGFGSVTAGLYAATNFGTNAKDGSPGSPGAGGVGGKSITAAGEFISTTFYVGAGGGQGGVGGCGGKGAKGGGAGGGSIALVVDNSVVSIELSQLITNGGGAGQAGHAGGRGQPGGEPGNSGTAATAAFQASAGGKGGDGGRGGDSGAGAGGPSIGIVFLGNAPAVSETTYVIGEGGRGGLSVRSPTVVNGISADSYAVTAAAPI